MRYLFKLSPNLSLSSPLYLYLSLSYSLSPYFPLYLSPPPPPPASRYVMFYWPFLSAIFGIPMYASFISVFTFIAWYAKSSRQDNSHRLILAMYTLKETSRLVLYDSIQGLIYDLAVIEII